MKDYPPRYVSDIKIMVIRFDRRVYDVYLSQAGVYHAGVYHGEVVFTTANKAKAMAVADYLSTLSRDLLVEIMNENEKRIKEKQE